jgi:hypothetical protein
MTVDRGASLASDPAAGGAQADARAGTLARAWRALLQRGRAAPGEAPRRGGSRVTLATLTLIAIQLFWLTALLTRSYFRQDDYFNFDRALADGFTWKYLMLVSAGHMAPFAFAMSWLLAKVSLYSWPLTSLVILAFVTACCLALLRVLRTLFGNRPAILIPLVVYLFSPLALAAVDWWTVAAQTLPLELSIFMAVDAHVRYLRSGRIAKAVAAAGWMLLGMATVEKGALIPLLLLGFTSAFFVEGRWPAAVVRTLRQHWRAWLLYGVLLAGYCVLFFIRLPGSTSPPGYRGPLSQIVSFATTLLGTTLVPGVLGGPWRWTTLGDGYAQAASPVALQQLSWAVALLVVVGSCVYRAHAWRAWAILLGWIAAADMLPVVIGRLAAMPAALLGLQARYVTDAATVLALCIGFAFLPLAGGEGAASSQAPAAGQRAAASPADQAAAQATAQWARGAARLVLAIFLVGSFWSLQALEGITNPTAARSYIATARAAVAKAPRGTLIVDAPTPAMIMNPIFFNPYGNTSYVIGALARADPARHLSWTRSPHGVVRRLMIFDTNGQLRPAVVAGVPSRPLPPGQRCWSVTPAGTRVPLQRPLFQWGWTVRLDYSGPAVDLVLRLGGKWAVVTLPAGAHAMYVPLAGSGNGVTIDLLRPWPGGCLTGVTVGTWQPAQSGLAIPAAPVPG